MLDNFDIALHPDGIRETVSQELLDKYGSQIPVELKFLWERDGFGHYNQGLFQLINPEDFRPILDLWLGKTVTNYTPFAMTAFGELFYFRKLNPTEGDICMVDIQFRKIEVITWEMEDFLNNFLTNEQDQEEWLRVGLFQDAISVYGALDKNEIFTLAPILALGGEFNLSNLSKGNAQVYQNLVFAMTS